MNDFPASIAKQSLGEDNLVRVQNIYDRVLVCIRGDEDLSPNLTGWFSSLLYFYCLETNLNNSECIAIIKKVFMCLPVLQEQSNGLSKG